MLKKERYFFIGFVVLELLLYALLSYDRERRVDLYLKSLTATVLDEYNSLKSMQIREYKITKSKKINSESGSHSTYVDDRDGGYIVTYIVDKERGEFITFRSGAEAIWQIDRDFWLILLFSSIGLFLLLGHIIRTKSFNEKLNRENRKLFMSNRYLKSILDLQEQLIILTDGDKIIDANKKVLDFFGYSSVEEMVKKHRCICELFIKHSDFFHKDLVPKGEKWYEYIQKLPPEKRVINMINKDMDSRAFQVSVNKDTQSEGVIITLFDVTEIYLQKRLLEFKAKHDPLTGIYNRQKLDEVLENMCKFAGSRKENSGVIMFDIDHFKKVNDSYGHDVGDRVLKFVASKVSSLIREEDIFGRWGGEEFLIILRYASLEDSYKKAQILCEKIAEAKMEGIPQVTISLGVTKIYKDDTPQKLFKRVDLALYEAKRAGRNRAVLYDEMATESQMHAELLKA